MDADGHKSPINQLPRNKETKSGDLEQEITKQTEPKYSQNVPSGSRLLDSRTDGRRWTQIPIKPTTKKQRNKVRS